MKKNNKTWIQQLSESYIRQALEARWLMEDGDLSNMPTSPTVQNEPTNSNSTYTSMGGGGLPTPELQPGVIPGPDQLEKGKPYTYTENGNTIIYYYDGKRLIITVIEPSGAKSIFVYEWNGKRWYPVYG